MKLSILLPTRNGAHLLEHGLSSVLAQKGDDIEIVISDNASSDHTPALLADAAASDARVTLVRLDDPVPVTDNWNTALEHSTGDHLLVIGDDDYLLPGYVERIRSLLEKHDEPDILMYNAYALALPGTLPGSPQAHYADPFFPWDTSIPAGRHIDAATKRDVVLDMFRFQYRIHLNLQTAVIARAAVDRLPQGAFRAPFPDFYALYALLLTGASWVYEPEQPIVIGISPKSFGRTVHAGTGDDGLRYLGISTAFEGALPGDEVRNGTYIVLERLLEDFPEALRDVRIDHAAYVRRQVFTWLLQWRAGALPAAAAAAYARKLRARDWLGLARSASRISPMTLRVGARRGSRAGHLYPGYEPLPGVRNASQFAAWQSERSAQRRGLPTE